MAVLKALNTKMVKCPKSCRRTQDDLAEQGTSVSGINFWIHGTDHRSAINIIQDGIDLPRGKPGTGISDSNVFYLTSTYTFAHHWARAMMKKQTSAVIVFNNKSDMFTNRFGH